MSLLFSYVFFRNMSVAICITTRETTIVGIVTTSITVFELEIVSRKFQPLICQIHEKYHIFQQYTYILFCNCDCLQAVNLL